MTPEAQKIYETFDDLFLEEGWKLFQKEIANRIELINKTVYDDCDTSQKWFEKRGQIAVLSWINNFEEVVKASRREEEKNEEDLVDEAV